MRVNPGGITNLTSGSPVLPSELMSLGRALITTITDQDESHPGEPPLVTGYEVHGIVHQVALEDVESRLGRLAPLES